MNQQNINQVSLEEFLKDSTAQSLGKFGEFLFAKFCESKKIKCSKEHENGVDFIVENNIKIDVKAVREIKHSVKERFRRVLIKKQIPNVHYAYIIFWKNSIELRVEVNDLKYGNYDCHINTDLIDATWLSYDKKSIKFVDKHHIQITKQLKSDLTNWISDNLNIRARVIQRKVNLAMVDRGDGDWGADNFYENSTSKHQLVVLLAIANGRVEYIHSYPTREHENIPRQIKPVGTNLIEIWCYKPKLLPDRYRYKDINDFKFNVKERFGF